MALVPWRGGCIDPMAPKTGWFLLWGQVVINSPEMLWTDTFVIAEAPSWVLSPSHSEVLGPGFTEARGPDVSGAY